MTGDEDDIELLADVGGLTPAQAHMTEVIAQLCAGAMLMGYSLNELWREFKRFRSLRTRTPRN